VGWRKKKIPGSCPHDPIRGVEETEKWEKRKNDRGNDDKSKNDGMRRKPETLV
jgi:hypothetical protein